MQLCNVRQCRPVFCALTLSVVCFEIFMVTALIAVFLGRQLHQINDKIQLFGDQLHLHCQGNVKRLCTQLLLLSHLPDDGDGVCLQNVGFYNSSDVAGSLRRRHRTFSVVCYVWYLLWMFYFSLLSTVFFYRNFEWEFIFSHCDTCPWIFLLIPIC